MYDVNIAADTAAGKRSRKGLGDGESARTLLRRQRLERETDAPRSAEKQSLNPVLFTFLKDLQATEINLLNARLVQQKYAKKEYIYLPYDNSEKVCFIIHGNVEVGYLDESGRELSIDILGPGEAFGALLGRDLTGGFARSIDKAVLAVLSKDDFAELLERHPRFALRIIALMNQRLNILEAKLRNLVFSDVKTRICKLLLTLFQKSGDRRSGLIKIPLTHQDIANLVASSRETASLHLSELKKSGIIAYERKRIRIRTLAELERF